MSYASHTFRDIFSNNPIEVDKKENNISIVPIPSGFELQETRNYKRFLNEYKEFLKDFYESILKPICKTSMKKNEKREIVSFKEWCFFAYTQTST